MEYKIGQILYILNKEKGIIPIKVVEIITREKENGKEVDALVLTPKSQNKEDTTKLESLLNKGEIFTDLEKLKTKMFENAKNMVNNLIKDVINFCEKNYQKNNKQEKEINFHKNDENNIKNNEKGA